MFEEDPELGSTLPDIYVSDLTGQQIVAIHEWLVAQAPMPADARAWDRIRECDVVLAQVSRPALGFVAGDLETFRHTLPGLAVDGTVLPLLTVCVEPDGLSFDYQTGDEWGLPEALALFELLHRIQQQAPQARIQRTEEGGADPTPAFVAAWERYRAARADSFDASRG